MQGFAKNQKEVDHLPVFPNTERMSRDLRLFAGNERENPTIISLKDIEKLPKVKLTEDFKCLEGWMVKGVVWEGINVSSILRDWEKKLNHRASFFLFGSGDFTCELSRRKALRKATILATKMHGRKLTPAHGGPLRLVFESHKCYESIKSLDRIVMLEEPVKTTARLIATSRIARKREA